MEHPEILNWRRVDKRLTLSGQPTAAQFGSLAQDGVEAVINLGPYDNDNSLPEEAEILSGLGLDYIYIPVDFAAPTAENYMAFCAAMDSFGDKKLHVHCIYNARVTAFMLRYARDGRGWDEQAAATVMDGIWRPGGVWATFLDDSENADQPNRYKGYEYDD